MSLSSLEVFGKDDASQNDDGNGTRNGNGRGRHGESCNDSEVERGLDRGEDCAIAALGCVRHGRSVYPRHRYCRRRPRSSPRVDDHVGVAPINSTVSASPLAREISSAMNGSLVARLVQCRTNQHRRRCRSWRFSSPARCRRCGPMEANKRVTERVSMIVACIRVEENMVRTPSSLNFLPWLIVRSDASSLLIANTSNTPTCPIHAPTMTRCSRKKSTKKTALSASLEGCGETVTVCKHGKAALDYVLDPNTDAQ